MIISNIKKIAPKYINSLLFIFFLAIGFIFFLYLKPTHSPNEDLLNKIKTVSQQDRNAFPVLQSEVVQYAKQYGINPTMKILRESFVSNSLSINNCHNLVHVVGHLAYQPFQTDFVKLAQADYDLCGRAYQHGIEAEITLRANEPINELHQFCAAMQTVNPGITCYHGVGHAKMGDTLSIPNSLSYCDQLISNGPVFDVTDCYKGIFSELAFQIAGVDGDTGIPFPGGSRIKKSFENPLDLCSKLKAIYQYACGSQLSRLLLDSLDNASGFRECTNIKYSIELRAACVQILSAIISQGVFTKQTSFVPDIQENSWPKEVRQAYIKGIAGEFWAQTNSGKKLNSQDICDKFSISSDKDYCYSMLSKT